MTVRQSEFCSEDRLNASFLGSFDKAGRAIDRIMVSQRQRLHATFDGTIQQVFRRRSPIQQTEHRMTMQFDVPGAHQSYILWRYQQPVTRS